MVNIFIANLDWSITSDDLMQTFSSFGQVEYAHVVFEKETKRSKGYGYVEMTDTDEAIRAIEALNGMEINGRPIDVKIASPKGSRPEKKKEAPKGSSGGFRAGNRGGGRPGGGNRGGYRDGGRDGNRDGNRQGGTRPRRPRTNND